MDPRLQAGVELQVEKEAQQEHDSSLSGVLGQHFKKEAGWKSELAGYANPVNWPGIPVAAVAAALTKTRTLREQAEADKETWKNILIPGRAGYNVSKRFGHAIRGPEIKAERALLKAEDEEEEAAAAHAVAALRDKNEEAEGNAPEEKQASVTAGRVLSTMLRGINHA